MGRFGSRTIQYAWPGYVLPALLINCFGHAALQHERMAADALQLKPFIDDITTSGIGRVPGTAIFMTPDPDSVPHAMLDRLKHRRTLHEQVAILSVNVFDVPDIDRVEVHRLAGNFSQVVVRYGFKDEPDIPAALQLCASNDLQVDMMNAAFFLGRETLIPKLGSVMAYWRVMLFVAMFRNPSSATAFSGFHRIASSNPGRGSCFSDADSSTRNGSDSESDPVAEALALAAFQPAPAIGHEAGPRQETRGAGTPCPEN